MPRNARLGSRMDQERFESLQQEVAVGLLTAAAHLSRAVDRVCSRHGTTQDQYNVLRILGRSYPEGMARFQISAHLMSRAPDVTRLLDRLERSELVERHRSPQDRRQSISTITDEGRELLARVEEEVREVYGEAVQALSQKERWDLAHLLPKMIPEEGEKEER